MQIKQKWQTPSKCVYINAKCYFQKFSEIDEFEIFTEIWKFSRYLFIIKIFSTTLNFHIDGATYELAYKMEVMFGSGPNGFGQDGPLESSDWTLGPWVELKDECRKKY